MVLVVAADENLARACVRTLNAHGYRTVFARDPDSARAQLARRLPDAMLVDGELAEQSSGLMTELEGAGRPTIVVFNRAHLDEVLSTVEAITPPDLPRRKSA
jgi:DNA-binding response OmpR family regulator